VCPLARGEFKLGPSNPKAILIFTAFLPQFVDSTQAVSPQFAMLGALFLVLEWIAIGAYAYMGLHMRRWFAEPRASGYSIVAARYCCRRRLRCC
jgi:threonine/homoserine/homoserine lactone efflux protein